MAACQLHNVRCILQGNASGGRCALWGTMRRTPSEGLGAVAPAVRPGGPAEGGVDDDFDSRSIDSPSDRRYLLQFYLTSITAITVRWVEGGCAESVEHMVTLISGCIHKAWREALGHRPSAGLGQAALVGRRLSVMRIRPLGDTRQVSRSPPDTSLQPSRPRSCTCASGWSPVQPRCHRLPDRRAARLSVTRPARLPP